MEKIKGDLLNEDIIEILNPETGKYLKCIPYIGDVEVYVVCLPNQGIKPQSPRYVHCYLRSKRNGARDIGYALFPSIRDLRETIESGEYYFG